MFRIERRALLDEVWHATGEQSVLLTGAPGCGKSWLIAQFVRKCKSMKRPVLALAAEDFAVTSVDEIGSLLGAGPDLQQFVASLGDNVVFVIDGLDALRAERSQRPFRDLINSIACIRQCALVVSMRTYDLQESSELQRLFLSTSNQRGFRQIAVQSFSEAELSEAASQIPALRGLLSTASDEFREIVRNPFNLNLAAQLTQRAGGSEVLASVRSQPQLLQAYWHARVEKPEDGFARKSTLRQILRKMVAANSLSVPEEELPINELASTLNILQSDELIRRSATNRVSFTHNILFDYSMARLLLDEQSVSSFIMEDPTRIIFYRPALSFFFHHLWSNDRDLYWKVSLRFTESTVSPPRARVIPAVVAYESVEQPEELAPLWESSPIPKFTTGMVLRAAQTFGGLQTKRRALWLRVLERLLPVLDLHFFNEYVGLVQASAIGTLERDEQLAAAIARALLRWIWEQARTRSVGSAEQMNNIGAMRILPVALKFYHSDPAESESLVRDVLERCVRSTSGPHEAFSLAQCIDAILRNNVELAVDVYVKLFGYQEQSEDKTLMGGSTVQMFTSTRRQDYTLALHVLQTDFRKFLEVSPRYATLTAVQCVHAARKMDSTVDAHEPHETFAFQLRSEILPYWSDHSEIWDNHGPEDLALSLLDTALRRAADRLGQDENDQIGKDIISTVIQAAGLAVVWKRLVEMCVLYPRALFNEVKSLLAVPEFIAAPETTIAVGNLLRAAYAQLEIADPDALSIEAALEAIPRTNIVKRYEQPESIRDRLLACIPLSALRSETLRRLAESHKTSNTERENRPYFRTSFSALSPDSVMRFQGIDPDEPANAELLALMKPLEAFEQKYINSAAPIEECLSIEAPMMKLRSAVAQLPTDHKLRDRARGAIFCAVEVMLKTPTLRGRPELFEFCRETALQGAADPLPLPGTDGERPFDRPIWGSGQPRIEAAQALAHLLGNWGIDAHVAEAFVRLSHDPVPVVRLQVAERLTVFYQGDGIETFWKLAKEMMENERTRGVTVGLVKSLQRVAGLEPDKVVELLRVARRRVGDPDDQSDLTTALIDTLLWLEVVQNHTAAREELGDFLADPQRYSTLISHAVFLVSRYLPDDDTATRARARSFLQRVVAVARFALGTVDSQSQSAADGERLGGLLGVLEEVAFRIYSTLDVNPALRGTRSQLSAAAQRDLYGEMKQLIELLTASRADEDALCVTPRAADLLLQTLDAVLPFDPTFVVLRVANVCRAGSKLSYEFDQQGISHFTKFVEHVLADHKDVLRDARTASALFEALDVFVNAGWPEAMRLVFMMDQHIR
jgi:hypothetical protein